MKLVAETKGAAVLIEGRMVGVAAAMFLFVELGEVGVILGVILLDSNAWRFLRVLAWTSSRSEFEIRIGKTLSIRAAADPPQGFSANSSIFSAKTLG